MNWSAYFEEVSHFS